MPFEVTKHKRSAWSADAQASKQCGCFGQRSGRCKEEFSQEVLNCGGSGARDKPSQEGEQQNPSVLTTSTTHSAPPLAYLSPCCEPN